MAIYAGVSAKKSEISIYHFKIKGINRQNIFVDEEDLIKIYRILNREPSPDLSVI